MPDLIPDSQKAEIKPAFEERYKALLGSRYEDFVKYSMCYIRKSIRVNTLKISVENLKRRLEEHNKNKTRSTKNKGPFELIHQENYNSLSEGRKREQIIKSYKGGNAFKKLIMRA